MDHFETEIFNLRMRIVEYEKRLQRVQLNGHNGERLFHENEELREQIKQLEWKQSEEKTENQRLNEFCSKLHKGLLEMNQKNEEWISQGKKWEKDQSEAQVLYKNSLNEIQQLKLEQEKLEDKIQKLNQNINNLSNQNKSLESTIEQNKLEKSNILHKIKSLEETQLYLKQDISMRDNQIQSLKNALSSRERENKAQKSNFQAELASKEADMLISGKSISTLEQHNASLERKVANQNVEHKKLKQEVLEAKMKTAEVAQELHHYKKKFLILEGEIKLIENKVRCEEAGKISKMKEEHKYNIQKESEKYNILKAAYEKRFPNLKLPLGESTNLIKTKIASKATIKRSYAGSKPSFMVKNT